MIETLKQKQPHRAEPEMVFVQGGAFYMGYDGTLETDCGDDKKPRHNVLLSSFSIGKYPVTQGQWKAVMGSNPSEFKGDRLPVETVSWYDAQEFIDKLNVLTGKHYRLPTEAEWEYAARGGYKDSWLHRHFIYSGSDTPDHLTMYAGMTKTVEAVLNR